uniref:Uncharacterized protein n=1 Tax=Rhizophora mucronata TaxID=61149 RepID=A0A2P2N1L4_RHIMU
MCQRYYCRHSTCTMDIHLKHVIDEVNRT